MILSDPSAAIRSLANGHPWLTQTVILVTAAFILISPAALVLATAHMRRSRVILASAIGIASVEVFTRIAGLEWYQARPFVALHFVPLYPHAANASFPSSTTACAAVAAIVVLMAWRRLGVLVAIGSIVIGFGCVYVGVHYVSDVVVGEAIGLLFGAVGWFICGWAPLEGLLHSIDGRYLSHRRGQPPSQT